MILLAAALQLAAPADPPACVTGDRCHVHFYFDDGTSHGWSIGPGSG